MVIKESPGRTGVSGYQQCPGKLNACSLRYVHYMMGNHYPLQVNCV
ncbi:MAG: hypothetical protein JST81_00930 [Bacteroidetes bacterium]|nr:hypothetical protein [Bacteroidota bacterium]